jgi:hypothetical protein
MDIEPLKNELFSLLQNNDENGLKLYDNKIKLLINEVNKKLELFMNLRNELDNLKNHIINNTSNNINNQNTNNQNTNNKTNTNNIILLNNKCIFVKSNILIDFNNVYKITKTLVNNDYLYVIPINNVVNKIKKINDNIYHVSVDTKENIIYIIQFENNDKNNLDGHIICKKN